MKELVEELHRDIGNSTDEIKTRLRACILLTEPILNARVEAKRSLELERERLRLPKDKDHTDFDRVNMLNAAVADLQKDYDYLLGLENALKERLNLGYRLL